MNTQDAETIVAIAALAALADGKQTEAEKANVVAAAERLGVKADNAVVRDAVSGKLSLGALASRLSTDEVRLAAFDAATAVCHADGTLDEKESAFLKDLMRALGNSAPSDQVGSAAAAAGVAISKPAEPASSSDLETYILDQSMLAAACDLLPDNLATMAVLPLQLHMVYAIGQRHGQQFDMNQAKDLAGALGIGAAGHVMEGIVRGVLGNVGRGLLGGLIGGAAGLAGGSAVTFATTYALGKAANQYYAQGRKLSMDDLKSLFGRFEGEARTMFPRVEGRIRDLASHTDSRSVLSRLRG